MRMTIYMAILSDMRTLLFDEDKRSVSVQQIIHSLENEHVAKALREQIVQTTPVEMIDGYADEDVKKSMEEQIQKHEIQQLEATFDEKRPLIIEKFNALKSSELGNRLDSARSKMIAHKEINNNQGERALYNPTDFGLRWSDAKNILSESKELIYECNHIVNRTHVDLEGSQYGNK